MIGGVEKHCLEVGKRLVKKRYGVTVITERLNLSKVSEVSEVLVL